MNHISHVEIPNLAQLHFFVLLVRKSLHALGALGPCTFCTSMIREQVADPPERYFVLGGVSIFERGLFHQIRQADECVAAFGLADPHDIELHGSAMYNGRDSVWRTVRDRPARERMIQAALATLKGHASLRLFAVVIDKAAVSPDDPVAKSLTQKTLAVYHRL